MSELERYVWSATEPKNLIIVIKVR